MIQLTQFYDKYRKIIIPVGIVALLFIVYAIGCVNGKRSAKATTDTIQQYVDKVEKHNSLLLAEVRELKAKIHNDSIKIVYIEKQRDNSKIQYIYVKEQVSNLPLDSAVMFMAVNLTDKTKISVSVRGKDTLVSITPKDVKQVNITFVQRDYFEVDNSALVFELGYMNSRDSSQTKIIKNYEEIIKGKDGIIDAKDEQATVTNKQLEDMTKKYKWQKVQKFFWKFTALVGWGFAAIK